MNYAIVTGDLHIGKTTVCRKAVQLARQRGWSVHGFLTTTIFDRAGQRLGFTLHNLATSEERELARVDLDFGGPGVGPFHFDPAVLQWGHDIVTRALAEGCDLLVIDEIGRLELEQSTGFNGLLDVLAGAAQSGGGYGLLVMRKALLEAFRLRLPALDLITFEVTLDNRDTMAAQVADWLFGDSGWASACIALDLPA